MVKRWTVVLHAPVSQAYVAPENMRGRYMRVAGLTWGIGWSIDPLLAGLVMDLAVPNVVWGGCLVVGLAGGRRRLLETGPLAANGGSASIRGECLIK